ncbi:hypothetical protein FB451DRAFT_1406728 [Mycena latifolia]|nr:hypothetical protein FB451DRAFT_1406728 [Mycena latifolia]
MALWRILSGEYSLYRRLSDSDTPRSDPDPGKEDFAISHRGAVYTFGSGVMHQFLEINGMSHILCAHQLCMEGYASLFDGHLHRLERAELL